MVMRLALQAGKHRGTRVRIKLQLSSSGTIFRVLAAARFIYVEMLADLTV